MALNLPDEIWRDIITPLLHIPDEQFSFGDKGDGPFAHTRLSTSEILVVCKRWMRIGTPLLYHTVVIRSRAQAQALADALISNPPFGRYIQKLRMEGGFGQAPLKFISAAPNIRELFVSLDIWSDDVVSGLCGGFFKIFPQRLIIHHHLRVDNSRRNALWKDLLISIRRWSTLETVEYRTPTPVYPEKFCELCEALAASASSVKTLVLQSCPFRYFGHLASIKSLRTLRSPNQTVEVAFRIFARMHQPDLLHLLPDHGRQQNPPKPREPISEGPQPIVTAGSTPDYRPMHSAPLHQRKAIWSFIFSFATYPAHPNVELLTREDMPRLVTCTDPSDKKRTALRKTACHLSLVSRSFNEIVRPHMFRVANFQKPNQWKKFCSLLQENRDLAHLVRILYLPRELDQWDEYDSHFNFLLGSLTGLIQFLGAPKIHLRHTKTLAKTAGMALRDIQVSLSALQNKPEKSVDLGILPSLESVQWDMKWNRTYSAPQSYLDPQPKVTAILPKLHTLDTGAAPSGDTIAIFAGIRIPSLTSVSLSGQTAESVDFLYLNGRTITEIISWYRPPYHWLSLCPYLRTVTIGLPNPMQLHELFQDPDGHTGHLHFCKLNLNARDWSIEQAMNNLLLAFRLVNFSLFPSFREVRIDQFEWPNTERDIRKSPSCREFALLMKNAGITIYDSSGVTWRERARVRRVR
ncbi:hypothetical protein BD410DRAFT_780471 [Rickenella mellea]|uniref:Uncharacterized protein n=1 Tax=Rickenella mellea TaxID=50990 RepID=A0A4R5XFM8_9AGAM|nr:hypothetical protein BD410DRAFT_780471 [Rickenella mellea]